MKEDVTAEEGLVKAQALWRGRFARKRLTQQQGSGFSIEEESMPPDDAERDNNSLDPINMECPTSPEVVAVENHSEGSSVVSDPLKASAPFDAADEQSRSHMIKIRELRTTIESLEIENSRLKRKLQTAHAEQGDDCKEKDYEDEDATRRNFVSKQSSVGSFTPHSLYGGDVASPYVTHIPDKKPRQYEMYVSRTLKALEDDLSYLFEPTPFYKFGRNGSVRKTTVVVSPDFQFLSWKPSTGLLKSSKDCRVDLRLVWRLVAGQSTPPFEAYKGVSHGPMPPSRSFSLIYGFRSLDLCACSDESYEDWFTGLRYVLQLFNGDLQEAGLDRQLLRRKWNYLDPKGYGFLSRKAVIQLVSSLGIRFDRSSFTAALLRSTIGNSTHDEITFSQFDSLVYQLRRRPDLEILWGKILLGYDFSRDVFPLHIDGDFDAAILHEVIGVPAFKQFWKLSQGRVLTNEEANLMMAEGMGEMHQPDFPVLSYVGFQNIMSHAKNDAFNPVSTMMSMKD
ncbi:Plcl2, partial [Symbiodinium microadriaticum]